ncbi:hypothetical protein K491DRAFT_688870 [Lophiostoma macrostomum CBS 122681]|uniref:Uncharacterized protein n=1 Tax=Lophiostoma macrostomum CBS 122681 TaxID=1314788 RepID=A0A6A6TME9_9PLEO|nr:hypothetical protein K491DRAFT_688870 [Lophiostoma macrostomum CBS 122681]
MYFTKSTILSFGLLATSQLVAGHSAITAATGDQGGQGSAIGVDPNTPRDGTKRNPFQQDATRFKGDAAATCGETLGGGTNDIQAGTAMVMQLNGPTLPQVSAGGQINMTLHQVNGDGAGPYTCMIDATGTGTNWQPMQVTQNVAGNAQGRNNDNAKTDLPLAAAIPAGQTCTGTVAGQSNVCMVRCQNPARAGPFGGCVPVQMAGAATGATPAAAGASAAAGVTAPAGAVSSGAATAQGTGQQAAGTASTQNTGLQAGAGTASTQAGTGSTAQGQNAGLQAGAAQSGTGATAGTSSTTGSQAGQLAGSAGVNSQGTTSQSQGVQAGAGTAGTAGTQSGAGQATSAQGQTLPAQGQTVGSQGAASAQLAATKRGTKTSSDGVLVTDDEDEEEVEFLDGEDAKRWVVKDF